MQLIEAKECKKRCAEALLFTTTLDRILISLTLSPWMCSSINIVFYSELDASLFSFELPEVYKLQNFDRSPIDWLRKRRKSAIDMDRILKSFRKYVNEHDTQLA